MNDYLLTIGGTDNETASTIRERHARELRAGEAALDAIIRGLTEFGPENRHRDDDLESARLFLATRTFNSLRSAFQVLERGYYQQAMALVRMAMEDRLVSLDIEHYPPTLGALLDGEGKLGSRPNLTFGKMAERVSAKTKEVWDDDYGMLSEHGTHTRLNSLRGLVVVGPDGQMVIQPGGYYDETWVNVVLYYALRELVQVFATVAKVTAYAGIDWVTSALPIQAELDSLWRQIDERAREELGEPIGGSERHPFGEATDGESNG